MFCFGRYIILQVVGCSRVAAWRQVASCLPLLRYVFHSQAGVASQEWRVESREEMSRPHFSPRGRHSCLPRKARSNRQTRNVCSTLSPVVSRPSTLNSNLSLGPISSRKSKRGVAYSADLTYLTRPRLRRTQTPIAISPPTPRSMHMLGSGTGAYTPTSDRLKRYLLPVESVA